LKSLIKKSLQQVDGLGYRQPDSPVGRRHAKSEDSTHQYDRSEVPDAYQAPQRLKPTELALPKINLIQSEVP